MKKILATLLLMTACFGCYSQTLIWEGTTSPEITVDIPYIAQSALISVEFSNPHHSIVVKEMISPSGKKIIKSNAGLPSESRVPIEVYTAFNSLIRPSYHTKGRFSILIPQKNMEAGKWRMIFYNKDKKVKSSTLHINTKYVKDTVHEKPSLDIDINAQIKRTHIDYYRLLNALNGVKSVYGLYGININFHLDATWIDPFHEEKDLEKKIELFQKGRKKRLQLYLFERQSTIARDFQGLAGCLPSVIFESTSQNCSALVVFDDHAQLDYDKMTKVIAHEIAHLLGLFHLSDNYFPFGNLYDQMDDTDEHEDLTNVMHKTSDFFGEIIFSLQQIKYIWQNPIFYKNLQKNILFTTGKTTTF